MANSFNEQQAFDMLKEVGAYLEGHFLLTTGRHSNQFYLFARLTEHPDVLKPWAETLAERLAEFNTKTVVGPAVGGIIPAYAVASFWTGSRVLFAEKDGQGVMAFKRGFHIEPGESVLVVEDAVTTGSSVAQVVSAVKNAGGLVKAVGALIDRSQGPLRFEEPLVALLRAGNIPNWDPNECPLCQGGVPLSKPKS